MYCVNLITCVEILLRLQIVSFSCAILRHAAFVSLPCVPPEWILLVNIIACQPSVTLSYVHYWQFKWLLLHARFHVSYCKIRVDLIVRELLNIFRWIIIWFYLWIIIFDFIYELLIILDRIYSSDLRFRYWIIDFRFGFDFWILIGIWSWLLILN